MSEPLPIFEIIPALKETLAKHTTAILQAPPGAGKSTVLPLQLLEEVWLSGKKILMLEPRRLAARAVANRLAEQLGESAGETVGYRIRFESRVGKNSRIEILTEGILTRLLQQDNALEGVGLVIFDEFHERSLHADLALALCREAQQVLREDLRLLIMSATLDGEKLSALLGNAPVLTSKGRQHPVTVTYHPPDAQLPLAAQMDKAIRRALRKEKGDVLAFLPGAGEIRRTKELLEEEEIDASIHPLYGDLPQAEQQRALLPDPSGRRKVVLATSIAETSLTIEGIGVVVDCGFSRVPRFDPRTGLTRLDTVRVSQDTADQRAGRAGRLGPGVCYRLWTEAEQRNLRPHRTPEILEADLSPTILELANWGVYDVYKLAWLTPPPSGAAEQARELLHELEALSGGRITERGRQMLRLPTHPRIAHLLLDGKATHLAPLAADIAAVLEERDPLPREAGCNLTLRIEALRKCRDRERVNADRHVLDRIERLSKCWRGLLGTKEDNSAPADEDVGKLLASAYPERVAKQTDQQQRYRLANGRTAKLQESDPLIHEKWLAVAHLDAGQTEGRIFLASPLDPEDILYRAYEKKTVDWDAKAGELVAQKEFRIGEIIVARKPLREIPENQRVEILCRVLREEGLSLLPFTEEVEQWRARVGSLRVWRPAENWPDVSDEKLKEDLEVWLGPYLKIVRRREDFKKIDLQNILLDLLPWPLPQQLDKLAPERIGVPSGSLVKLKYSPDGNAPVLAVRLQELFGLQETPAVNEGRTKVMLHLLSPAMRPMQVTQDLKSFWQNTYPEVRKELRVRYPKHHWPEDPWTAEAVRGAKRKK